jgi:hypothetical protein
MAPKLGPICCRHTCDYKSEVFGATGEYGAMTMHNEIERSVTLWAVRVGLIVGLGLLNLPGQVTWRPAGERLVSTGDMRGIPLTSHVKQSLSVRDE